MVFGPPRGLLFSRLQSCPGHLSATEQDHSCNWGLSWSKMFGSKLSCPYATNVRYINLHEWLKVVVFMYRPKKNKHEAFGMVHTYLKFAKPLKKKVILTIPWDQCMVYLPTLSYFLMVNTSPKNQDVMCSPRRKGFFRMHEICRKWFLALWSFDDVDVSCCFF